MTVFCETVAQNEYACTSEHVLYVRMNVFKKLNKNEIAKWSSRDKKQLVGYTWKLLQLINIATCQRKTGHNLSLCS